MEIKDAVNDENLKGLLDEILSRYGYDFTDYSKASLKRRINRLYIIDRFKSFAEFQYKIYNNPDYLKRFVEEITVNVTEMFRDARFYQTLRNEIIPKLGTYPFIKIWHAGCSTGEEVYSMAILLKEANLYHKSIIYATDINPDVIANAKKGIFPLAQMKSYSENYLLSGGYNDFSSYYLANYNMAKFHDSLKEKVVFATHNLVSDSSFNEFQLILCRNVLIYFDQHLQHKVFDLFDKSLENLGYLALGSKETLRFSSIFSKYKQVNKEKIWRKL